MPTSPPDIRYRIVSARALRSQMKFRRMTVRELAVACGRPAYKSTIGNLVSGARNTCSAHLAVRIAEALAIDPDLLFVPVLTNSNVETPARSRAA